MSKLSRYVEKKTGVPEKQQSSLVNLFLMLLPKKALPYVQVATEAAQDLHDLTTTEKRDEE